MPDLTHTSYRTKTLVEYRSSLDSSAIMVWWLVTMHIARGLKLDDLCGPFQPSHSTIL